MPVVEARMEIEAAVADVFDLAQDYDLEVIYLTLDRPHSVAMKMTRGPVFFERFAGTWRFERVRDDVTAVRFRYNFETRWPWLRPFSNALITTIFERDIRERLSGLKHAAEQTDLLRDLREKRSGARAR